MDIKIELKGIEDIKKKAFAGLVALIGAYPSLIASFDDLYLRYYTAGATLVVASVWITLSRTSGTQQVSLVRLILFLAGFVATVAVGWYFLDVQACCADASINTCPDGVNPSANYLPYFFLLGGCACALWVIFLSYTTAEANQANRFRLFASMVFLIVWLAGCRVGWHSLDLKVMPCLEPESPVSLLGGSNPSNVLAQEIQAKGTHCDPAAEFGPIGPII